MHCLVIDLKPGNYISTCKLPFHWGSAHYIFVITQKVGPEMPTLRKYLMGKYLIRYLISKPIASLHWWNMCTTSAQCCKNARKGFAILAGTPLGRPKSFHACQQLEGCPLEKVQGWGSAAEGPGIDGMSKAMG